MSEAIRAVFRAQGEGSRRIGSPFMGTLCDLVAGRLDAGSRFGARILAWPGDPDTDRVALRACAGLHALARSGRAPGLAAAYPPNPTEPEELWRAVASAIAAHDDFLHGYLDSPPQTNEVARSSVILGGMLTIADAMRRPLSIFEIGSSAGLNLGFDRYRYDLGGAAWGEPTAPVMIRSAWQGEAPRLDPRLTITARAGCDIRPIDPKAQRERLMSYIWPDQAERLARTEAALTLAAAAPWHVEQSDADAWVANRLSALDGEGVVRVLFHTIMWHYMPASTAAAITASMEAAGAAARPGSPLAWFSMEEENDPAGAAIRLRLWPGGSSYHLGLADFHGRWVRWQRPQIQAPRQSV